MAIPDYQTVMLPFLRIVSKSGKIHIREIRKMIADEFNLTDEERNLYFSTGNQRVIDNRVGWARTYLKKAGLIDYPERGVMELTPRGMEVIQQDPRTIDVKFLRQFPEFIEFISQSAKSEAESTTGEHFSLEENPEELFIKSFLQLKAQILTEVLDKIKSCSPSFFEELVVETIVKMGYGGSRQDAGQAIGKSGDEGIDGIIKEDRLGLDTIYLQAKRWEGNVSRPEIQKFAGALQGKRARKGIFITTSNFTAEAKEFVKAIDARIILISGTELVELMWEYNVGFTNTVSYEVKKIDSDFFND